MMAITIRHGAINTVVCGNGMNIMLFAKNSGVIIMTGTAGN
jgi:hypothetical protein